MASDPQLLELVRDLQRQVDRLATYAATGAPESEYTRYARQELSVLAAVARQKGRIHKRELLRVGEAYGYKRQGIGGLYQRLLRMEGEEAVLTDDGRAKIQELRDAGYMEYPLPPSSPVAPEAGS